MNNLQVFKIQNLENSRFSLSMGRNTSLQQIVRGCWDIVTHTRQ